MGIVDGDLIAADEIMNAFGSMFKDEAQLLYDTGIAEGTLKNVFYQESLSADVVNNFDLDSGDYKTFDMSTISEYIIIEADDAEIIWNDPNYNTILIKGPAGKWAVVSSSVSVEVQRAEIIAALFNSGAVAKILTEFTNITAVKTSRATDVDKRIHYAQGSGTIDTGSLTGTFVDTTNNTDCGFWSNLAITSGADTGRGEFASGNTVNTVSGGNSNEIGTDTTGDDLDNPADCQLDIISPNSSYNCRCIIVADSTINWVTGGTIDTVVEIDYTVDNSIPIFTLADTLSNEGINLLESTVIFKDTASETVTNTITTWNDTIDATSSIVGSISYDGGSNYEVITDATIQRNTNTGTALWLKLVITRTDNTKIDEINEWATKYNFY